MYVYGGDGNGGGDGDGGGWRVYGGDVCIDICDDYDYDDYDCGYELESTTRSDATGMECGRNGMDGITICHNTIQANGGGVGGGLLGYRKTERRRESDEKRSEIR